MTHKHKPPSRPSTGRPRRAAKRLHTPSASEGTDPELQHPAPQHPLGDIQHQINEAVKAALDCMMPGVVAQIASHLSPPPFPQTPPPPPIPSTGNWPTDAVNQHLGASHQTPFDHRGLIPSRTGISVPSKPSILGQPPQRPQGDTDFTAPMVASISPLVYQYVEDLTGKAEDKYDSFFEEEDCFSFTLSTEEVTQVVDREFLDFSVIFHRHQRSPYGFGDLDCSSTASSKSDMSIKVWARIFLAFQAENTPWHPGEATALLAYGDLMLKMEHSGMQWTRCDVLYRQKRVKQIVRRPRKVKSWCATDIKLYLTCDVPRELYYPKPAPFKCPQAQSNRQ